MTRNERSKQKYQWYEIKNEKKNLIFFCFYKNPFGDADADTDADADYDADADADVYADAEASGRKD